ncbi:hypothetical protein [Polaribacter aquimarinus]|uniref:TonB C-terminal domain-containing protein n=1 Tax=Polaribacter aquimarinus TaxID=2100726 RepID=A0A2U2J707_9FLAO|nr:hypothetical protein [Polaribacter aquimarinus]PWG04118.1 hypothetical protein DIS07_14220 [Polaribacter aquimarinus]
MILRVLSFFVVLFLITSCDKFSFSKNKKKQTIDTIVDFSSVDTYPSFPACDSIIEKNKKSNCFRNTIHKKIAEELLKHKFIVKDSIDEIVIVGLKILSDGMFVLDTVQSSENLKQQLPELDNILKVSILKLPKVYPAIKRGIPVKTKYKLPVRILLQDK